MTILSIKRKANAERNGPRTPTASFAVAGLISAMANPCIEWEPIPRFCVELIALDGSGKEVGLWNDSSVPEETMNPTHMVLHLAGRRP